MNGAGNDFAPSESPGPRGKLSVLLCWLILISIGITVPILYARKARAAVAGSLPTTAATQPAASEDVDFQTEVMGKYITGVVRLTHQPGGELIGQMADRAKTPMQRVALGIVTAETTTRAAGLGRIEKSGSPDAPAFAALYSNKTPLPDEIARRYGYFARLAESIDKPATDPQRATVLAEAQRVVFISGAVFVVILIAMAIGFGLLVTAVVLAALGKMRLRVGRPRGRGAIYVEAFTIYLLGLIVAPALLGYALPGLSGEFGLAVHLIVAVGGILLGLFWPVLRGVPWRTQRDDWGITLGRNIFVEMLCGIGGYVAGIPIVGIGFVITLLLAREAEVSISHPIVQQIASHPILMLLLASVFAPLTEETFFRGALLSHLRGKLGAFLSAAITALMFASVHPQGWAAIPLLGSVGFVLAMIRQWRGTLLASMTAHALNNAAVLLIAISLT